MTDTNQGSSGGGTPLWRRRTFWLGGGALAGLAALGAVAPRVLLVREAAQAIVGSRLERGAQDRLEAAARAACAPIDDKRGTIEFRIQVAGVLTRRAALIALDRARTN